MLFGGAATDHDSVVFSHLTDYRQLRFAQAGEDLLVTQFGQASSLTVQNWFADVDNDGQLDDAGTGRVEQFTLQQDDDCRQVMRSI